MSQYQIGSADVTNGSATVAGTNTAWASNAAAGDLFAVPGDGVLYAIASVDGDGQITLAAPYAGATATGVAYAISRDFTPHLGLPLMEAGAMEAAAIHSRAMVLLDQYMQAVDARLDALES